MTDDDTPRGQRRAAERRARREASQHAMRLHRDYRTQINAALCGLNTTEYLALPRDERQRLKAAHTGGEGGS